MIQQEAKSKFKTNNFITNLNIQTAKPHQRFLTVHKREPLTNPPKTTNGPCTNYSTNSFGIARRQKQNPFHPIPTNPIKENSILIILSIILTLFLLTKLFHSTNQTNTELPTQETVELPHPNNEHDETQCKSFTLQRKWPSIFPKTTYVPRTHRAHQPNSTSPPLPTTTDLQSLITKLRYLRKLMNFYHHNALKAFSFYWQVIPETTQTEKELKQTTHLSDKQSPNQINNQSNESTPRINTTYNNQI